MTDLRRVVRVEFVRNSTGGPGGSRWETLECGHEIRRKYSQPRAQRRRCDEFYLEERDAETLEHHNR